MSRTAYTTSSSPSTLPAKELIDRHYAAVYNLAYRTLGRREDAEDVAQETFVRALSRLDDVRDPAAVGGWLCRIAANVCTDKLRQRQRHAPVHANTEEAVWEVVPDADPHSAPEPAAERQELRLNVWRAMMALPPQQRLALALRELHGMSYTEIAAAMRTSVSAVETLLFRARQGFRRAYEGLHDASGHDPTCEWVLARLSASIDRELTPSEQERVDAHVAVCPSCQFAARELRATSRLYGLVPLLIPPPHAQAAVLGALPAAGASTTGGLLAGIGAVKMGLVTTGAVLFTAGTVWTVSQLSHASGSALPTSALPTLTMSRLTDSANASPSPTGTATATTGPSTPPPTLPASTAQTDAIVVVTARPATSSNGSSTTRAKVSPTRPPFTTTPTTAPLTPMVAPTATATPTVIPRPTLPSSSLTATAASSSVPTSPTALPTSTLSPTTPPATATPIPTVIPTGTATPTIIPRPTLPSSSPTATATASSTSSRGTFR